MKSSPLITGVLFGVIAALVAVGCKQMGEAARQAGAALNASGHSNQYTDAGLAAANELQDVPVTAADQRSLGQSVAVSLTSQKGLVASDSLNEYVTNVGLTVAAASPRPELNYTFGVLDSDELNAYSAPGGYVMVTRGALRAMQDESELAGVLAHEIAHVCNGDSVRAVRGNKAFDAVVAAGSTFTQADYQDWLVKGLTPGVKKATSSVFSQNEELAADAAGVKMAHAAGYDPRGLARFLDRLPANTELFPSHPRGPARVAKINTLAGPNPAGQTLRDRYQTNLRVP